MCCLKIKAIRIKVSEITGFSLLEMVYHIKPPDKLNFHYKDDSKYLNFQDEKENQKTDIVNM